MNTEEAGRLLRENEYLKARCAQLQDDVDNLAAQLRRMHEQSRVGDAGRRSPPNPLSGGQ